jgi:molybdate transport system substrate-binding protein
MRISRTLAALATATALGVGALAGVAPVQAAPAAATPRGTITVSAAASLTDVFPAIARAFQKRYPGTTVKFNYGGSSTLVTQVLAGAPVDVLATASEPTMWKAVTAGAVGRPLLFAKNTMAIAMPDDNPAGIRSLADLARPGVLVGLCDVSVPCGAAARDLLRLNNVTVTPVTRELDVRALLGKVMSGDLDAGIVYVTDVRSAAGKVASVSIPASLNVTTTYPIATVGRTPNPVLAQTFVNYVRYSLSAQGLLRAYGFAKPW